MKVVSPVIASESEAIHRLLAETWIASSLSLLAMTDAVTAFQTSAQIAFKTL